MRDILCRTGSAIKRKRHAAEDQAGIPQESAGMWSDAGLSDSHRKQRRTPMTIALITGGSRGLGRSAALHLARAGVDIVLTYVQNRPAADDIVAAITALGRKAVALHLDAADTASFPDFRLVLEGALEGMGADRIDFLVNNAGTGLYVPFAEVTEAQFDSMIAVHLKGPYFLTQTLLPLIRDGGRILNVSSGLARFALPGSSAYASAKGAVEVWTRYLAKELGPRGISANVIAPGAIETDFGGGRVRDNADLNRFVASNTAMGRVGLPDDIGAAVASILTSAGNWITGQRIEASGGQMI
jgi:NAD(P)-dependent dehydrogenase (short-subunit alcohol dehydrogenase family)